LADFQSNVERLGELGISVYAASVDSVNYSLSIRESGISFPLAYGFSKRDADILGAWWESTQGFVEPAYFLVSRSGVVLASTYCSGAIGGADPMEFIGIVEKREGSR